MITNFKIFENISNTDKSIYEKDGKTVVNIYKIANEMMDKIDTKNHIIYDNKL